MCLPSWRVNGQEKAKQGIGVVERGCQELTESGEGEAFGDASREEVAAYSRGGCAKGDEARDQVQIHKTQGVAVNEDCDREVASWFPSVTGAAGAPGAARLRDRALILALGAAHRRLQPRDLEAALASASQKESRRPPYAVVGVPGLAVRGSVTPPGIFGHGTSPTGPNDP